jgi:hypothetical protein
MIQRPSLFPLQVATYSSAALKLTRITAQANPAIIAAILKETLVRTYQIQICVKMAQTCAAVIGFPHKKIIYIEIILSILLVFYKYYKQVLLQYELSNLIRQHNVFKFNMGVNSSTPKPTKISIYPKH